jgi:hypothetical protein
MTVGKENPFEIIFSTKKKRRISDQIDHQRNHLGDREPETSQSVFVEHEQSIENTVYSLRFILVVAIQRQLKKTEGVVLSGTIIRGTSNTPKLGW